MLQGERHERKENKESDAEVTTSHQAYWGDVFTAMNGEDVELPTDANDNNEWRTGNPKQLHGHADLQDERENEIPAEEIELEHDNNCYIFTKAKRE